MKLQSVNIKNFRCFEDITIDFHEQLTVLVGGNGCGKSAVLDAIAPELATVVSFSCGTRQIFYDVAPFKVKDIRKRYLDTFPEFRFSMTLYDKKLKQHNVYFDLDAYEKLVLTENSDKFYFEIAKELKPFSETLFVYYPAKRLVETTEFDKQTTLAKLSDAYDNMLASKIDIKATLAWFDSMDAVQARERDEHNQNGKTELLTIPALKAVKEAIESIIQDYENPRMKWFPPELAVTEKTNPENTVSLAQLSDGYRTMLALVMDLARRMAIANSYHFDKNEISILNSPAVVLIDEVDLLLHPSWQQRILPDLMRTFPNTQFIVTTHSPQVLSSVRPENIRILHGNSVLPTEVSTFGAESSRILEDIFGVPVRPPNDAKKALEQYFALINAGAGESDEAMALRNKIEIWLYEDPILDKADMFIARIERQKERKVNKNA